MGKSAEAVLYEEVQRRFARVKEEEGHEQVLAKVFEDLLANLDLIGLVKLNERLKNKAY